MVADVWLQRLARCHTHVRPFILPAPTLGAVEREWVRSGALPVVPGLLPPVMDVARSPMQGPRGRMPWCAPVWDAGGDGEQFVPGFVRRHVYFWHDIILQDPLLRCTLVSYLRERVGLHDLLLKEYRGSSIDRRYGVGRFLETVFKTRVPPAFASFVDAVVQAFVDRGCVAKWADVRGPGDRHGPA